MPKYKDLTGQRFGRLTVLSYVNMGTPYAHWLCKCDCGNEKIISKKSLDTGRVVSCGCYRDEIRNKPKTHGMTHTRLYTIWRSMVNRCRGNNQQSKRLYKDRGIAVCQEWVNSFETFSNWASNNGYKDDLTIDRIDNSKGYSPDNCRWATPMEQANNRRNNRIVEYNGEKHTLSEWARITGINRCTLQYRIAKAKWPVEKALCK